MSFEFMSGWDGVTKETGKPCTNFVLSEEIKKLCPQLANFKFIALLNEQKGENEKAPDWKIIAYIPKEDTTSNK